MIVLVTGAGGFLGGRVARKLLASGQQVRGLVRPGRTLDVPGAVPIEGDVCSADDLARALEGVDAVVHAAALVRTTGRWEEFEATNVEATRRLLAAATGRSVVHVSSLSVYAIGRDGETITEDSPYESGAEERGLYSRSKLAADRAAMEAAAAGAAVTVIRPGVLYGSGRRPPLARQSMAVSRFRLILGGGKYLLPLAHVDNVADAIALALTQPLARGRAYTIVDPQIPLSDYLSIYRSTARAGWRPLYVPTGLLMPAASLGAALFRLIGRRSPVTPHQIRRATWSARFDCSRARSELGWKPHVSLAEGLRQSVGAESITTTPALAASVSE